MRMRHLESLKSLLLACLVILSVILTFSIWSYTPKYELIEQPPTVDVSIAKKRELIEVIKPYKMLFHFEDGYQGTTDIEEIDSLIKRMKDWKITDLTLEKQNFDEEQFYHFMQKKKHLTLFFMGDVPLPAYDSILNVEQSNIPEVAFDRIVIEWSEDRSAITLYFLSQENYWKYKATVQTPDPQQFYRTFLELGRTYDPYVEVTENPEHFLVVPEQTVEIVRNTYYQEETSPTKFRDALFNDPNAVRRTQVGGNLEEYQDDHALMTVDTEKKVLHFVQPVVESKEMAIPSDLILSTIDFVNEHGGWTDDYRYAGMNPLKRKTSFQLYAHGYPVWSDGTTTSTTIEQIWGEERVFKYSRPYYTLDLTLPSETSVAPLPSGKEVTDRLKAANFVDFSRVEEILPAYYLRPDEQNNRVFILEPAWYYSINGNWTRLTPEALGGVAIGLE